MPFDWHQFHASEAAAPTLVDSRRRMRICTAGFLVLLLVVFGRAVQLELTQGTAFRAEAVRPIRRETSLPGVRGRILARDGTVLAEDRRVRSLAVAYRWLQQTPDPGWLRQEARRRLTRAQRRDPARVAAAENEVEADRRRLAARWAESCGISMDEWDRRARRIQTRVERIAESVRRLRPDVAEVVEEREHHVIVEDLAPDAVLRIAGDPDRHSAAKVVERIRRVYPAGTLAAHVVGHLGPAGKEELNGPGSEYHPDDLVGRAGLERRYETLLRGRRGTLVELANHDGEVQSRHREPEPGAGCDLVLTLDPALERSAEALLDAAQSQRKITGERTEPAGGAVVVMDVHSGALVAAASAPRFDPGWFLGGQPEKIAGVMDDPARPLVDRAARMAIAPGSTFMPVSAAALVESGPVDPQATFFCQGYLREPDRQRCAIYQREGTGHGDVTLADALAVTCNVYFFHHCGQQGPASLVDWALRFGFARPTGVDLPAESSGIVPAPATVRALEGHAWRPGDTQTLAIGQGSLTATPLQIARMTAAIANGGRLVTPHLVARIGRRASADEDSPVEETPVETPSPVPIGLQASTLAALRRGLWQSVSDPRGTAHGTVYLENVPVAGKLATVETAPGRAEHGWFAGYVPADRPRFAVVVVLEHGGPATTAAGPIARRLIARMQELGML